VCMAVGARQYMHHSRVLSFVQCMIIPLEALTLVTTGRLINDVGITIGDTFEIAISIKRLAVVFNSIINKSGISCWLARV